MNKLANICQLPKLKDSINKTEFELNYLCVCSLDSKFDKLSNDVKKFEEQEGSNSKDNFILIDIKLIYNKLFNM